jgi:hypothetical protein
MQSIVMLSVIYKPYMLSVVMQNVIMLSVVMMNAVAARLQVQFSCPIWQSMGLYYKKIVIYGKWSDFVVSQCLLAWANTLACKKQTH